MDYVFIKYVIIKKNQWSAYGFPLLYCLIESNSLDLVISAIKIIKEKEQKAERQKSVSEAIDSNKYLHDFTIP